MDRYYYMRELPPQNKSDPLQLFSQKPFAELNEGCYVDLLYKSLRGDEHYAHVVSLGHQRAWPTRREQPLKNDRLILHYATAGRGSINGLPIRAGQAFLVLPNTEYTIRHAVPFEHMEYYWISLRGHGVTRTIVENGFDRIPSVFDFPYIGEVTAILHRALYAEHPNLDLRNFLISVHTLIVAYHKPHNQLLRVANGSGATPAESYYNQAKQYIIDHFTEDISPPDVARELHISYQYLRMIFQKYSEKTVHDTIAEHRIEYAQALLTHSRLTLRQVAEMVGFHEYAAFLSTFKKLSGCTPTQFLSKNK